VLTRLRVLTLVATVLLGPLVSVSTASAAGPDCKKLGWRSGSCTIKITQPPEPSRPDPGGVIVPINDPKAGGSSAKPKCLQFGTEEVPCSSSFGPWSNEYQGYCAPTSPPPPQSADIWQGRTTGVILDCSFAPGGPRGSGGGRVWAPAVPGANGGAPVPTMTPAEAAAIVIKQMDMRGPGIGIVPEDKPGRLGLVGMPVWMWVANPGPATYGPQTITGSAGGITITATAKVSTVTWHMGDGAVINCTGPGTPYLDSYGKRESPDCGHTYSRTSRSQPGDRYSIVADSHWQIDWTGGGQTGQQTLDVEGRTSVAVGELQVLVTH